MSRRIADLLIKIGADSYEFQQRTKQVEKSLEGLQKKMTSAGKTLSKTLTLSLVALGTASVMAADTQVQAETRLLTALQGREDIQRRLMAQAAELQSRSTFGDEEVIAQQAYLASLGMTERQINDVIEASAQLSTATGMTLESAVKNLAKTYGGLTGELGESIPALKSLTAEQLKSGEAVKYILENYKGYAEAAAQAGAGRMRQLKNQLGDFAEQLGMILMPALIKIVGWIQNGCHLVSELESDNAEDYRRFRITCCGNRTSANRRREAPRHAPSYQSCLHCYDWTDRTRYHRIGGSCCCLC